MISNLTKTIVILFFMTGTALGAHPLITDDTGTNGKGKFQIELTGEFARDEEKIDGVKVKDRGYEAGIAVSAGILENLDIICGLPYQWIKTKEDGTTVFDEDGISDVGLELKWRFFEQNGFSLAIKPGITIPTGDEDKGFGTGEICYGAAFIASKEIAPFSFHINLGYTHNQFKINTDEESGSDDIWHLSLAGTYDIIENLQMVSNLGIERNSHKESSVDPAFALIGFIYSITPALDIDLGFKRGLTKTETDYALMTGLTIRF